MTASITMLIFNPIGVPVPVAHANPAFGAMHFVAWLVGLKAVSVFGGLGTNVGNAAGIGAELHRRWEQLH